MALTHADLDDARAIWTERVGDTFDLDVQIVGEHAPAKMDPDRPLGAVLSAKLSLRMRVYARSHAEGSRIIAGQYIFDERCPYERDALLRSVRALSAHLLNRS